MTNKNNSQFSLAAWLGLARSMLMYYGLPWRGPAWRRFYRQFISPGDLAFDIGAHVGNRVAAMLGIGARVIAVEPQPLMAATLQKLYGRRDEFRRVNKAVGEKEGKTEVLVSSRTPTVSTISEGWIDEAQQAKSFTKIVWDLRVPIEVTTLDKLIAEFGKPVFCKIDIEGYELEALRGLSQPLSAISFEYLPPTKAKAIACIDRLLELAPYSFNVIRAEYPRFSLPDWVDAPAVRTWLLERDVNDRAGEVYARLAESSEGRITHPRSPGVL